MIYVVANPTIKVVKIGWCDIKEFNKFRLARRLQGLQCGSPHKLYLLAYWPGSSRHESLLHTDFKNHRMHGEWFDWCDDIERRIVENTSNSDSYIFQDVYDFMKGEAMPVQPGVIQIKDQGVIRQIRANPLFKFREQNAWSLRIVAAKIGCSQTTVSKWEDGSSYPMDENMIKIAEIMKCGLEDLKILWREWHNVKYIEEENNGNKKDG